MIRVVTNIRFSECQRATKRRLAITCLLLVLFDAGAQPQASRAWSTPPVFNFVEYLDTDVVLPEDIDLRLPATSSGEDGVRAALIERYTQWIAQNQESPDIRAHLTNLAVLLAEDGRYEESITQIQTLLTLPGRIDPMREGPIFRLLGDLFYQQQAFQSAIDAYRTAQQLTHLHAGVLDTEQVAAVDRVIRAKLSMVRQQTFDDQFTTFESTDLDQQFTLYLNEKAYGAGSEQYAARLLSVGDYMRDTALMLRFPSSVRRSVGPRITNDDTREIYSDSGSPQDKIEREREARFRRASRYYEDAIAVIEDINGRDDPALIEPLTRLSELQSLRGMTRPSRVLRQRIVDIAVKAPLDLPDRINTIISAADFLHIRGHETAMGYYQLAWQLLTDDARTDLRDHTLGEPRLIAGRLRAIELRETTTQTPVLIVRYNIQPNGRTSDVQIIESNIDRPRQRAWVSQIERLIYRPRWSQDGPVGYTGIERHARFILPES